MLGLLLSHPWCSCMVLLLSVASYIGVAGTARTATTEPALPFQQRCRAVCGFCATAATRLLVRIVTQGPVPRHVAFIMDGNRRYARKSQMDRVSGGHYAGFEKLSSVLEWCRELGIANVSVFAFAINNFGRSAEEVGALMRLAEEKLVELADRSVAENNRYLRIRVAGNRELLPAGVVRSAEYAELVTKDATAMTLNVCFPYSATDEISCAIRRVVEDAEDGAIAELAAIGEDTLEQRLRIPGPDLDILVRTSGEIRFSNYMLWQSARMAYIQFVDVFWPEFSFFHMFRVLVSWQMALRSINKRKAQMGLSPSAAAAAAPSS
ncbi:cis-prenyltransferase [Coemansia sp. Benny D160-2]|nr:cis-prenyltransferase [Coemansia sp. Benny D160-2]